VDQSIYYKRVYVNTAVTVQHVFILIINSSAYLTKWVVFIINHAIVCFYAANFGNWQEERFVCQRKFPRMKRWYIPDGRHKKPELMTPSLEAADCFLG
jgi:hypothetical protein